MKKLCITLLTLTACTPHAETYKNEHPKLVIEEYFNGPIQAWGHIKDWKGHVTKRFDIDLVGTWKGNVGTLEEVFHYYDGSKPLKRAWKITKTADNTYIGEAADAPQSAKGTTQGNSINWNYSMNIPVDNKVYTLQMNDWMHLMNDNVLINQIKMKKFGITVGEITIFMKK